MFVLKYSKQFKKDLKNFQYNKKVLLELEKVLDLFVAGKILPKKYHSHLLKGEFKECFECHLRPDILLVYKKDKREVFILLLRVGSHSDLF